MSDDIQDAETAIDVATEYADAECVGELGEVIDARREENVWVVEFRTHTFSDAYEHRVRITASVGNVISHDRSKNSL